MYILAIETTGKYPSVAVIDGENQVREKAAEGELHHLELIIPMVEELLGEMSLSKDRLTGLAVSQGPGSFTGIRIGVATARALAQALEIPVVGVPTLASFLYHDADLSGSCHLVCPLFNARRNQVYGGAFAFTGASENCPGFEIGFREYVPGGAYELPEYLELLSSAARGFESLIFYGDGIDAYGKALEEWKSAYCDKNQGESRPEIVFAKEENRYQKASSVVRLGKALFFEGKAVNFEDLKPVYLRKAEAERKLEEGIKKFGQGVKSWEL